MPDEEITRFSVEALGVRIPLEARGRALAEATRLAWQDALVAPGGDAAPLTVMLGDYGQADVAFRDIPEALHHLSPAVTRRAIAARAGELVMLHAAALADPDTGATVVLVAPSGTGKTTASLALGQELAYLTDETAAITPDGQVLPYRKPLSIIESGHLKAQRSPRELGLVTTERDCHLAAMLVVERRPDHAGDPIVEALDTVDALAALAPEASSLGRLDQPLQRLMTLVRQVGGVRHVTYSEASTLAPIIQSLLSGAHP